VGKPHSPKRLCGLFFLRRQRVAAPGSGEAETGLGCDRRPNLGRVSDQGPNRELEWINPLSFRKYFFLCFFLEFKFKFIFFFCLDLAFYDLEFGIQQAAWDKDMLSADQIYQRFKGFEDVNSGLETATFVIHNLYNSVDIRRSLIKLSYDFVEFIIGHKAYKTQQPPLYGHIPAVLTCHLATKSADIWARAHHSPDGAERQSLWPLKYAPRHAKTEKGENLNKSLQSDVLVRKMVTLFPSSVFGTEKLLVIFFSAFLLI
jgi:hypothetical protein